MRSKSPLALMEQVVMVMVFALAAALCLRVFVYADQVSGKNAAIDTAVAECQTVAETLKACKGDWKQAAEQLDAACNGTSLTLYVDKNWRPCESGVAAYMILAEAVPSGQELLGKAEVVALAAEDEELFRLTVAWQEVNGNE